MAANAPANSAFCHIDVAVFNRTAGTWYVDSVTAAIGPRTIDEVGDGSTYARIAASELSASKHKLTIAGSAVRLGDLRNAPGLVVGGVRSLFSGLTFGASWDSASPANVTITTSACTLIVGSASISFNALSASATQTRGSSATYYVYADDATYAGGSPNLFATVSAAPTAQGDGRVYFGSFNVTVPAGATSGSGGTGGGSRLLP
ncbi:MAG: hypothetical protein NVS9B10_16920 [Nevskia sp.]